MEDTTTIANNRSSFEGLFVDFGKSIELSKDRGVELLTIVFLSVMGI